ncbi:hypothetical protein SAMD00019534_009780 [Acytostelium subglobosum LB1]|uniref:hypothetical protein n=1 Tax=Acytostelium subglobosum LB1 TaxID=1410327 RepID=UPI000644B4D2|nr:hypothetical protein SAMD00019534_009780 [Acytostelium subglobosum LB1]GAM17803.1 hypothetical protein SAMD00019534_009780 [Acytostelium subglobosum LB1]|eukprot:XP_012758399.1 hypothetical protein SAMD00019534_009780 [Acytostelium subglobosum LB1]
MEEYSAAAAAAASLISRNESPDQQLEKVVVSPQKPVDSMNIIYSWMVSMIASVLSFNGSSNSNSSSSNSTQQQEEIELIKDNNNSIIKTSTTTSSTSMSKNKTRMVSKEHISASPDEAEQRQLQANANVMSLFSVYNQNLVLPVSKKTLILDLDETLVHSTLTPVSHHHLTVNVLVEDIECTFYVIKRPHVDYFIEKVSKWYDLVIFTASMKEYADPLLDQLDQSHVLKKRLFRESCLEKDGNFVKDLSLIHQDLATTIIIDNSPIAYSNNIENALPINNWMGDDPMDESLLNLLPFLEVLQYVNDVRSILSLRFNK